MWRVTRAGQKFFGSLSGSGVVRGWASTNTVTSDDIVNGQVKQADGG